MTPEQRGPLWRYNHVRIEIWSDIVCPWCYIGKRRLEKALADFDHAAQVEVVYRSYQLDPGAPSVPTQTVAESLGEKYGGGVEAGRRMIDQVEAVAAEEGLLYQLHNAQRVGTMDAHRLLHLAADQGGPEVQGVLKEALLAAYFVQTRNVADHAVLQEIAVAVGLDASSVADVLTSTAYADAVEADIAEAGSLGATGVPFFVVDRKFGIAGAQPSEAFTQVLQRAWREAQPSLLIAGQGEVCGPDGCTT